MKHYRLYKLKTKDGGITKGKDMLAADDRDALVQAQADEDCPICEIWDGARPVGSIDEGA